MCTATTHKETYQTKNTKKGKKERKVLAHCAKANEFEEKDYKWR